MARYNWRDGYVPRRKREEPAVAEKMTMLERNYIEGEVGAMMQRILKVKPTVALSVVVIDAADPEARAMAFGNMTPDTQRHLFNMLASVPDDRVTNERLVNTSKPEVAN